MDLLYATLQDLKKERPDLCDQLFEEFLKNYSLNNKDDKEIVKDPVIDENGVKIGDALRWNYTKEEGVVVGFENDDDTSNIVVRRFDGSKILFENDPKLFTILEGEEKANVISKREQYVAEARERKDKGLIPNKPKKAKIIYDGVMYDEPTRRGSKLKVGDRIRFMLTKDICIIKGFFRKGGLDRIFIGESSTLPDSIIDNPNAYEIVDAKRKNVSSVDNTVESSKMKGAYGGKKKGKNAKIGDWIIWKPTGIVGKVIDYIKIGTLHKLVIKTKSGVIQEVYDNNKVYEIIK